MEKLFHQLTQKRLQLSKGVVYMLVAVLFFSTMGLAVKLLDRIPAIEVVFFRSLISLILSVGLLKAQKVSVWGKHKKYLLLRGITGAVALMLFFVTLQAIPLGSAVVMGYMAPIFATLLGIFIAKERVYARQWLFFLLSFGGILLVEGFDPRVPLLYFGLGLIASVASGMAHNFIRKVNTKEHPLVIIFYFPLVTLPITALYCALVEWKWPQGEEWLMLLGIGLLTQIAQFFMTKSLQLEEISKVAIIRYVSIVFALSFGFAFFGETYEWYAYLGMLLVIAGAVLNVRFKNKMGKSKAH